MAITDVVAADELGQPSVRSSSSGGWKSARLIIGVEMAERFAYFGISSNLIMYLTGPLGESTASAAANVNAWTGTVAFLPLLWAFVADAFLGRYRTIVISSSLYISGLGLVSFSAMIMSHSKDLNQLQVTLFFCSLYLVAIGQGGYKPCIKVFGADQFDGNDLNEAKAKSSFFNWLMFGNCISILTTRLVSNYIQENLSWSLGFGIPSVSMLLALFLFVLGTTSYRFSNERGEKKNAFARLGRVFMEAVKNRREPVLDIANPNETLLLVPHHCSKQFRFLDKAAISCNVAEIEEAKAVLRLVPIWITCLIYAIVSAQTTTLFTKQGATMDRSISQGLLVPAATLQCFTSISIVIFIPIYDRLFTMAGLQEFFYDQVPSELRSIGMALNLSIYGVGNFLSSFIISVIDRITSRYGQNWFDNDLNHAHVDYFYWLLACLSFIGLASYLWFAKSYVYNRPNT